MWEAKYRWGKVHFWNFKKQKTKKQQNPPMLILRPQHQSLVYTREKTDRKKQVPHVIRSIELVFKSAFRTRLTQGTLENLRVLLWETQHKPNPNSVTEQALNKCWLSKCGWSNIWDVLSLTGYGRDGLETRHGSRPLGTSHLLRQLRKKGYIK